MADSVKQGIYAELGDMSRKAIDQMSTEERWQKLAQLLAIELRRQVNEEENQQTKGELKNGNETQ